jgi:hypothetical protein
VKSEARKIAELQCKTQIESQCLGILTDALWSTILGFVAVHELRKRDLVGPVADDILYAGIIAVNTARQPGLQDLAGKGMDVAGIAGAAGVGLLAGKVASGAGGAAAGAAAGGVAGKAAGKLGTVAKVAGALTVAAGAQYAANKLIESTMTGDEKKKYKATPFWKKALAFGPQGFWGSTLGRMGKSK